MTRGERVPRQEHIDSMLEEAEQLRTEAGSCHNDGDYGEAVWMSRLAADLERDAERFQEIRDRSHPQAKERSSG